MYSGVQKGDPDYGQRVFCGFSVRICLVVTHPPRDLENAFQQCYSFFSFSISVVGSGSLYVCLCTTLFSFNFISRHHRGDGKIKNQLTQFSGFNLCILQNFEDLRLATHKLAFVIAHRLNSFTIYQVAWLLLIWNQVKFRTIA